MIRQLRTVGTALWFVAVTSVAHSDVPDVQMSGGDLLVRYTHSDIIESRTIDFPSSAKFSSSRTTSTLSISYSMEVGLEDLQTNLARILEPKVRRSDDCGDVVQLERAALRPGEGIKAAADVSIHYERWICTYADIPEVRCTDTWIKLPFGGKTKGIPKCTTRFNTKQTSKSRMIETGLSGTLLLGPSVLNGNSVRVSTEVTNVNVQDDLARIIVDAINVDLRAIVQSQLEQNLGNGGAIQGAVPPELLPFFQIEDVAFFDRGGGSLGVRAIGSLEVTISQISDLCSEYKEFC